MRNKDVDGAVFILLGQSNAVGHGVPMEEKDKILEPLKNVFGLDRSSNQSFDLKELHWSGYTSGGMNLAEEQDHTYSVANCLARLWQKEIDAGNADGLPDLYIIQIAIGAEGVSQEYMWYPGREKKLVPGKLGTVDISLYPYTRQFLFLLKDSFRKMGKTMEIMGIHWRGGEEDSTLSVEEVNRVIKKLYEEMFSGFYEALGEKIPVVLHRFVNEERDMMMDPTGGYLKSSRVINRIFEILEEENENISLFDVRKAPHYVEDTQDHGIFIEDLGHYNPKTNAWVAASILADYKKKLRGKNKFQKLNLLPLGSIQAEGFLKDQLLLSKEGITGQLYKLEPGMIYDPYIRRKSQVVGEDWGSANQDGWMAEIAGNYWTGYIQAAFTLGDEEMIRIATEWVDTMMKNQWEDGYLGVYEKGSNLWEDYNAWGTACVMRGLIAFYEATGREDVLTAVYRCMLWFCENWAGDRKTSYGGSAIIEPMIFVYHLTGDERLVSFAKEYEEYLCKHDIFQKSYESFGSDEYHYNSEHTAGYGVSVKEPALIYTATGEEKYLQASCKGIEKLRAKSCQLSGGPVSISEYLGPVSSTAETEYCSFTYFGSSYSYMSYITGEAKYGDYMEEMFYNGTQGARKKDEKAIAYLSAPNQIYATSQSSEMGAMQVYAPCYPVSCCPVNAVVVLPEFIRGMILRDEEDNLYVMAYGPCSLKYQDYSLRETTLYPFRNHVTFEINCKKDFTLYLRIPQWAEGYTVTVNGQPMSAKKNREGFAAIHRAWSGQDTVEIHFEASVKVLRVDDSDASGKYPLAIKYGALLFSYHIPEIWKPIPGNPVTPLPEGWSWYEIHPDYQVSADVDHYEKAGVTRYYTSWNVALDENLKAEDFEIEELPEEGYVWSNPPIKLHTYCYKAPYLCSPYPRKTYEPFEDYQYVTEKQPLTLEPYGCTNLRITYFPKAKL